jgi:hypothetical protein
MTYNLDCGFSCFKGTCRCLGEASTGFGWGNLMERDHWVDPGVDVKKILRWIFRKWDVGVGTGSGWLRIGTGGGKAPSGSIKCG